MSDTTTTVRPCGLPWWNRQGYSNQCPFNRSLPSLRTVALIASKSRLLSAKPLSLLTGKTQLTWPCFIRPLTSWAEFLDFIHFTFSNFLLVGLFGEWRTGHKKVPKQSDSDRLKAGNGPTEARRPPAAFDAHKKRRRYLSPLPSLDPPSLLSLCGRGK